MAKPRKTRTPVAPRSRGNITLPTDEAIAYDESVTNAAADEDEPDPEQDEADRKALIVKTGLKRWQVASDYEAPQRAQEEEDLKFDRARVEDQWPDFILNSRNGGTGPDGKITPRLPCLVIPKLDQPVQQVINEARTARLSIRIKPKGEGANKEGARIRQGIIRSIEVDSNANTARLWALDRAVKCGRGFYRILKKFANDGDFDLDLVIAQIENQASVYFDPYAVEPDKSDARWCFITSDLPVSVYTELYPDSKLADSAVQLIGIGDDIPEGWISGDEDADERTIRVAEYFYVETTRKRIVDDPLHGVVELEDDAPPVPAGIRWRYVEARQVKWCVINAREVLIEEDWQGRYIPVIPVIGKRYNVNGERTWKGVITNAKDAQRSYNYMRSKQVQTIGLASLAPYVVAEGQLEGYEDAWNQANVRPFSYLYYKPTSFDNKLNPPPRREVAEPAIDAITVAVREADNDIKATTGRFDPSLGRASADRSGKAINALKSQAEMGTSNYLDDLATVSMAYEGKVLVDLMPYVYDTPARQMRILGEEDTDEEQIILNAPFYKGPNGPVPVPPEPEGFMAQMAAKFRPGVPQGKQVQHFDLSKGQYSVTVTVGRSFATQREENAAVISDIMTAVPALAPIVAPEWLEQMDNPAAQRIADKIRKANPQPGDNEDGADADPQALMAEVAGLRQQAQEMGQALQGAQKALEEDAMEQMAKVEIEREKLQSAERIASANNKTKLLETLARIESSDAQTHLKAEISALETQVKIDHEVRMTRAEHAVGEHVRKTEPPKKDGGE